ncbi:hypothetical protein ACHAPQ_011360 [Fusarium lateritium]
MDSLVNTPRNNRAMRLRRHNSSKVHPPKRSNLLALPWDILEQILKYVFREEGGYAFDSTSEKLVTASGTPINLSLMYTCRTIWEDTKDMPLSLNNISFSTMYTPEWRPWAGRYYHLCNYHRHLQTDLLFHLRAYITPGMRTEVDRKFSNVMPKLREELDVEYGNHSVGDWQRAPSGNLPGFALHYRRFTWYFNPWEGIDRTPRIFPCAIWVKDPLSCRQATEHTLRLVAKAHPKRFTALIEKALPNWSTSNSTVGFLGISLNPWDIPSRAELDVLGYLFEDKKQWAGLLSWPKRDPVPDPENYAPDSDRIGYQEKCRFSATAAAIWFIRRLSLRQRLNMRNVKLIEDKLSVNKPAIHCSGLIPLCQENPNLRIQCRLMLSQALSSFRPNAWGRSDFDNVWNAQRRLEGPERQRWVSPCCLTSDLLSWIAEASRLPTHGMPAKSYTLVLDGGPHGAYFSDLTQNLFLVFCAMALAYDRYKAANSGRLLPDPSIVWVSMAPHWAKALSVPIGLVSDSSRSKQAPLVQSTFDFGTLPDIDRILDEHAGWNINRWLQERNLCLRDWIAPYPAAFGRWQDNVLENYEREPTQANAKRKTTTKRKRKSTS